MRIFKIRPVYDRGRRRFRSFEPVGDVDWLGLWRFDGSPKATDWNPEGALVQIESGTRLAGDFVLPGLAFIFAMTNRASAILRPITENVGELLPLRTREGELLSLLNVTPTIDCIDHSRTRGERNPDGTYFEIERYEFDVSALPRASLFRPTYDWSLFAVEGAVAEDLDFKLVVERYGLQGIRFREVWNDDGSPVADSRPGEDIPGF